MIPTTEHVNIKSLIHLTFTTNFLSRNNTETIEKQLKYLMRTIGHLFYLNRLYFCINFFFC